MQPLPTVIVPVYRDVALTKRCLDSAVATLPEAAVLIIINDASPEAGMATLCQSYADKPSIRYLENSSNLGFVATANLGFDTAENADVVLLNSDTEVPDGWLERVAAAADRLPRAASLTPFTNNGTICSYPFFAQGGELPEGLDLAALDACVAAANPSESAVLPTAVGFCMYMRRAAIDEIGGFDAEAFGRGYGEENDWCCRATAAGWQHYLMADLFVYHQGGASFGVDAEPLQDVAIEIIAARYPEYGQQVRNFIEADPIAPLRRRIDDARLQLPGQGRVLLDEAADRLRAFGASLRPEIKTLRAALDRTRDEARAEAVGYQSTIDTLSQEQARLIAANNEAQSVFDREMDAARTELSQAKQQIAAFEQRVDDYDQRCAEYEAHAAAHVASIDDLTERCRQYDQRCEQYEQLLGEARQAYASANEQINTLNALAETLQREKQDLEAQWGLRLQRRIQRFGGKS